MSDSPFLYFTTEPWPGIILNQFMVKGDILALIDTGLLRDYPRLRGFLEGSGFRLSDVRLVLNTHPHNDHIGANGHIKDASGCIIAAAEGAIPWIEDHDRLYREWCLRFPDLIPDSAALRNEILGSIDHETHVDVALTDGAKVRLGAGIELETMKLSGHVSDELAFYESSTETLILGDAITSFRWDHFQGHESPKAYRHAIAKLRAFMQQRRPKRVLMAHHSDQTPQYLSTLLDEAETFLDKMDELVLSTIARARKPVSLGKLWAIASAVTNKDQDLYGLITVHAHARELVENGTLASPAPNLYVI